MAYKLIILPEVLFDINEAASWYEEKQKGLGKRFINAIKNEMPVIMQNPLKYSIRYDDVRTALTKTFPYLIHFTIEDTTIIVKAIYHTSRNSEIWNDL
jgi:ParE toxin of type II toxin-antitoxin system, parDE